MDDHVTANKASAVLSCRSEQSLKLAIHHQMRSCMKFSGWLTPSVFVKNPKTCVHVQHGTRHRQLAWRLCVFLGQKLGFLMSLAR